MNYEQILNNLSQNEREVALKVLKEYGESGKSQTLDKLQWSDFDEIPVDIYTFITDDRYLGRGVIDKDGKQTIFPYWIEMLKKLFPNNMETKYNTLILTGCLGYDTDIPLLNGKVVKIGELADIAKTTQLDEYVYSFDLETNQYVPGRLINAFSTGVKKVYRITLDNGKSFVATSNHQFLTLDKHWKSIDSGLCVGFSLMPYGNEISHNHKIVKTEFIGEQEVFDLTVEKYHNFALNCGIVAHNSIGIGKSMCAVLCMLYLLYRMLCLKDPYLYYGLQPIDKITFSLINVTIEAAKGVAWDKLQQLVQSSPWFMSHGKMSGRTEIIWTPDKRIELVVGSSNNAVIGRAVFCLDGNTEILTDKGYKKMKSLVDKKIRVVSYDNGKLYLSSPCTVRPTGISNIEYHIELEDGAVIKCTENHKFLLKKLGYIQAKDVVVGDIMVGAQPNLDLEITEVSVVTLKEPKQFYDVVEASPLHNFIVKTVCGNIVSHNCNFTDKEI